MASYLVQAGTSLYRVNPTTGVATALTLPTGVTLYGSSRPCRAVVFGSGADPYIIVVNGATKDLVIDKYGTVRTLQIQPPISGPTVAVGGSTGLTGVYEVVCTYKVKDSNGVVVSESALGPPSAASAALANQSLSSTNIPIASDPYVNARGMYRTLSGGVQFYPWFDIDDNVTNSEDRAGADASLSLLPTTATNYGPSPRLSLITTWKDRLWAIPVDKTDYLRWTEERLYYAWNPSNEIVIPPQQTDVYGATALIPRRDQLGVARYNRLYQITGDSNDTFQRTCVSETIGSVSESVVIVRDVAYFLGPRGLVEWSSEHIGYVSEAQVDPWFNSDTYFNRALFSSAVLGYNPETDSVEIQLAAYGSSVLDRWVSFELRGRRWFGPHKTNAFTASCRGTRSGRQGIVTAADGTSPLMMMGGSDGYLYYRDRTAKDDAGYAVALDVLLPMLGGVDPDTIKMWQELSIHGRAEVPGVGTLSIIPTVGDLGATAGTTITHSMSVERQRLARPGVGRYLQLELTHAQVGEGCRVYGLYIPYVPIGRR